MSRKRLRSKQQSEALSEMALSDLLLGVMSRSPEWLGAGPPAGLEGL